MARPRKADGERRSEVLYIRQTPDARAALDRQASVAGLTPTDFARQYLEGAKVTAMPASVKAANAEAATLLMSLDQLTVQTKRIGNNVNQLALSVHRDSAFSDHWQAISEELQGHMQQLQSLMDQVGKAYDRSNS